MTQAMLVLAGLAGFLGVAFGAFGAHALREKLPPERSANLELAVRYLFFHVPALVAVAWLASAPCTGTGLPWPAIAGWSFAPGILLFCGSLLILALTGNRRWGAITPIGGVLLLVGWVALAVAGWHAVTAGDLLGVLKTC